METVLIRPKSQCLSRSGIPVVCRHCYSELYKTDYQLCSKCGSYLCPDCYEKHKCK